MAAPGAYGLRFAGIADPSALLAEAPRAWPLVHVVQDHLDGEAGPATIDGERASLRLIGGGRLVLERRARTARFRLPTPIAPDELVHPHLAPVASMFAAWLGRESLHAGAFAVGGVAVAVLGQKEAGKSTTLAALAARAVPIVADDVVVVEDGRVFAGPRCLDVRDGSDTDGIPARNGERTRVGLPPIEPWLPLRGIVSLAWGPSVELEPLPPADRLVRLAAHRWDPGRLRPTGPVELSALPAWELRRPGSVASLPAVCDLLVELAGTL